MARLWWKVVLLTTLRTSKRSIWDLTTWLDAHHGKIQRFDVTVSKNYLSEDELYTMAKIVNAYLDLAELRASDHIPMTMEDWVEQFDMVLRLPRREILTPCRKYFCCDCKAACWGRVWKIPHEDGSIVRKWFWPLYADRGWYERWRPWVSCLSLCSSCIRTGWNIRKLAILHIVFRELPQKHTNLNIGKMEQYHGWVLVR